MPSHAKCKLAITTIALKYIGICISCTERICKERLIFFPVYSNIGILWWFKRSFVRYNKYRRELDEYVSTDLQTKSVYTRNIRSSLMRDALVEPSDRNRNKFNLWEFRNNNFKRILYRTRAYIRLPLKCISLSLSLSVA